MQALQDFLHIFSPSRYGINILDIVIVVIVAFYAYEGYALGLLAAAIDLVSFVLSFLLALKGYSFIGGIIGTIFTIPIGFANAIGFFLVALVTEILLNIFLRRLIVRFPSFRQTSWLGTFFKKTDHILGLFPGIISSLIILSFLLTVIISLPSSPFLKQLVSGSQVGSRLVANTALFESKLNNIFGGALNETLNFLTIEPQSNERVNLRFTVASPSVDTDAEVQMLNMVNKERKRRRLKELTMDKSLRNLARSYSQDMFQRGYFSHYDPEGLSPFGRMDQAGIIFTHAGENLALAPSTDLAMQGLMNSPGHRANILSPDFAKVGIGVMDGGIYGKMFSQEFTD